MKTIIASAAALYLFTANVVAADVHKCKGANGETIYQNAACPGNATPLGVGHYDHLPDRPNGGFQNRTAQQGVSMPESGSSFAPGGGAARTTAGAFECSANGKAWVQTTECPATSSSTSTGTMTGYTTTGQFVTGTVTTPSTVDVQQKALQGPAACAQISMNTRTAEHGRDADSGYQRNKMRSAVGCN